MALVTKDFVFIHVPKTAGTYCRHVIQECYPCAVESLVEMNHEGNPFEEHYGVEAIIGLHPLLAELPFVGFVRHPVTWYKSRWAWGMMTNFKNKIEHKPAASAHWMAQVWSDIFPEFISNIIDHDVPHALETFKKKLTIRNQWIYNIGRYENLVDDLRKLTGCAKFSTKPQRVGKVDAHYDSGQKNMIRRLESEVIKKFY